MALLEPVELGVSANDPVGKLPVPRNAKEIDCARAGAAIDTMVSANPAILLRVVMRESSCGIRAIPKSPFDRKRWSASERASIGAANSVQLLHRQARHHRQARRRPRAHPIR